MIENGLTRVLTTMDDMIDGENRERFLRPRARRKVLRRALAVLFHDKISMVS